MKQTEIDKEINRILAENCIARGEPVIIVNGQAIAGAIAGDISKSTNPLWRNTVPLANPNTK